MSALAWAVLFGWVVVAMVIIPLTILDIRKDFKRWRGDDGPST